ncbi:hypothetical protein HaLaN_17414, partial [Haematococcus lacustris]
MLEQGLREHAIGTNCVFSHVMVLDPSLRASAWLFWKKKHWNMHILAWTEPEVALGEHSARTHCIHDNALRLRCLVEVAPALLPDPHV